MQPTKGTPRSVRMALSATLFVALMTALTTPFIISAQVFSSASYEVIDPVLYPAGYATSTSYSLTSTIAQVAIGTSTNASSTEVRSGFEYFPFVTSPVITATPADGEVGLSWSASSAMLGWTVGGYQVARSSVSGGPYTYTNVGLVLSSNVTGLTNGSTYYFVVRTLDAFGNPIASSTQVSAVPNGPVASSGGGGGSGSAYPPQSASGTLTALVKSFPFSGLTMLDQGVIATTSRTTVSADTPFLITLPLGSHQVGFYATDDSGMRSSTFAATVMINEGRTSDLSTILLSPTLAVDKSSVKKGDPIALTGSAYPGATITVFASTDPTFASDVHAVNVAALVDGKYAFQLGTGDLPVGEYTLRARGEIGGLVSAFSIPVRITVGDRTIDVGVGSCAPGDLNEDLRVSLTDFSIATYWYKRTLTPAFIEKERRCLNADGKVNIYDFSLMAYYWTG